MRRCGCAFLLASASVARISCPLPPSRADRSRLAACLCFGFAFAAACRMVMRRLGVAHGGAARHLVRIAIDHCRAAALQTGVLLDVGDAACLDLLARVADGRSTRD